MRHHRNHALARRATIVLAAALGLALLSQGASTAATVSTRKPAPSSSTSASGATTAPTVPCGLATYAKPDGSAYSCSFSDEFSGSALDSAKWSPITTAATGQRTGVECDVDTPDTLSVGGDSLTVTARRLKRAMNCQSPFGAFDTNYTGGMITTSRKFAQAYGRFEMRARFPKATVAGLQSSLWMYPQTLTYGAWPNSGEIDIAEWFSGWGTIVVPHLHYHGDVDDPYRTSYNCTVTDPSSYHTYALEWTPMSITFLYDGQTCLQDVNWMPIGLLAPAPFDQPFNLLIGNGRGTGNNAPTADTPFPSTLQVDYVRAWS
jgi:beta-glucanase (GH16 family)